MCIYNNTPSAELQDNFKPTWLYIKQHNITKLKYFGKTISNPSKYIGSGKEWTKHLKEHGRDISTVWTRLFLTKESLSTYALKFSIDNQIVASEDWANMIIETGLAGVPKGKQNKPKRKMSDEHKRKIADSLTGRIRSDEHKKALSDSLKGRQPHNKGISGPLKGVAKSAEHIQKMKKPKSVEHRKNIGLAQLGKKRSTPSAETREKMSAARTGLKRKPLSQETKDKISATLKAKSK